MARKAVVFFSHKSEDNARAIAISQAIEATPDVKTTIDVRDLRPGAQWRGQLYRWIARCDAGFLLLTPAVMANPGWVLEEATLLRARQIYHGDRFPLFWIIEPGVRDTTSWKALFDPLALGEIQRIDASLDDAQIGLAVAQGCKTAAGKKSADYFSRLRDHVGDALSPFEQFRALADLLHEKLDVADEYWQSIVGDESVLSSTLAQRLCEARETPAIGTFGGLDELLSVFEHKGQREQRGNLLHALRPYWVNLGAALKLAATTRRPEGRRLCALPTSRPEIAPDLHIDRFFAPYYENPLRLRLAAGNESLVGLTAQLIDAWNDTKPLSRVTSRDALNAKLRALTVRVIVILPPLAVAQLASEMAAAFPVATFIVPVLRSVNLKDADWNGIEVLEPVRRDDEEEIFATQYDAASAYA